MWQLKEKQNISHSETLKDEFKWKYTSIKLVYISPKDRGVKPLLKPE